MPLMSTSMLEVKFNTDPADGYNDQGIIIEQDADNCLRFDVYDAGPVGTGTEKLFVGSRIGGSNATVTSPTIADGAAMFLRVTRTGDHVGRCSIRRMGRRGSWGPVSTQALSVNRLACLQETPWNGLEVHGEDRLLLRCRQPHHPGGLEHQSDRHHPIATISPEERHRKPPTAMIRRVVGSLMAASELARALSDI